MTPDQRNRCPSCVIADEKVRLARRSESAAAQRAVVARELAIVALRMLHRDGRLKPTTDDERAAVELAGYQLNVPAGDRRVLHPQTEGYVSSVVEVAQTVLFDAEGMEWDDGETCACRFDEKTAELRGEMCLFHAEAVESARREARGDVVAECCSTPEEAMRSDQ